MKATSIQCPAFITGEARIEWKRVTGLLKKAGTIDKLDRGILATYCSAWGTFVEADEKIKKTGMVIKTKKDNIIPNPYLGIRNTAIKLIQKCAHELGFTPRARASTKRGGSKRLPDDILQGLDGDET